MNANRRKAINEISARIATAYEMIGDAINDLQDVRDEEEEAIDNLPESLQESERADAMREALDNLDAVVDSDVLDVIIDIMTTLEDAAA